MSELSDLFAKDPLKLTDQDIDKIVVDMRVRRAAFMAGQKASPQSTKEKKAKPTTPLNLEDLM